MAPSGQALSGALLAALSTSAALQYGQLAFAAGSLEVRLEGVAADAAWAKGWHGVSCLVPGSESPSGEALSVVLLAALRGLHACSPARWTVCPPCWLSRSASVVLVVVSAGPKSAARNAEDSQGRRSALLAALYTPAALQYGQLAFPADSLTVRSGALLLRACACACAERQCRLSRRRDAVMMLQVTGVLQVNPM